MANLFELAAKLTLDSSDYEKGIEAAKQAAANFAKGLTSVVTAVSTTDRAVSNAADSAENFGQSATAATNGVGDLSDTVESVTQAVRQSSDSMEDAADSAENLSSSADRAAESVENVEDSATNTSQKMGLLDRTVDTLADGFSTLERAGETVKKGFDTVHGAVDTVKSKFQSLTDAGKSLVDGGLNKIQSGVENVRNKFSPLASAAQNLIGAFSKTSSAAEENADAMEEDSKSADTLKNRIAMLQGVYDAAKKEVERLTDEFNKSAEETGATSDETKELARQLDKAEREMNDAQKALDKYSDNADDAADATKKLGDEEEKTTKKTSTFKDTLKALLSRDMIVGGLKALWSGVQQIGRVFINVGKQAVEAYGNYEQLAGGAKKIFENMDFSQIEKDAKEAYKDLNMSASQYLEAINLAGSSFAQTMGDKKGYETARKGMIAIADYASGTGKNINELNQKYQMISRSASVYQSIADQFSGILPQTSADFLKQAQSAGFLEKKYKKLTEVPVAEYQQAVTKMIEKGVGSLGLLGNTAKESTETLTGSLAMTKAAWENLLVAIADEDADFDGAIDNLIESAAAAGENLIPRVEQVIKGIGRAIEKLLPIALEEAPKAIARYAPEVWNTVKNLLSIIYTSLNDTLVNTDWNALGGKIADGINNIDWVSLFGDVGETISNALVATLNLLSGFVENVDWFNLGQEIFYSVVAVVENIDWQEVVATAFRLLGAAIGGAGALIGGLSTAIKSVFEMAKAEVKAYFDEKIKEAGGNVVKGIFNGIIEGLANVGSWIYNNIFLPFINGFKSAFGINSPSTVMKEQGKYIVDGLLSGIKNMPTKVMTVFAEVKNKITSWGNEIKTKIKTIGTNLVTGLWNGISDKAEWVKSKIGGFGSDIINKIKSVFGVHSPSTVMKQIGDFLMQGLSIGVDSNAYKPIRSVSNVGDEMTRAFDFDGSVEHIGGAIGVSSYAAQGTNTERLLMLILETLRDMDESMYERISSAIDGMAIDWNDRELGRFVKSYA